MLRPQCQSVSRGWRGDSRGLCRPQPRWATSTGGRGRSAGLPPGEQPSRLPQSLEEAVAALEQDDVLPVAMGEVLFDAFVAVRRAEAGRYQGWNDDEVVAATRWLQ